MCYAAGRVGTRPTGTTSEQQAAEWVKRRFAEIAPKYDLLNHVLSFNIDRGWRKALGMRLAPVLQNRSARVLDLCCGTGDVLFELRDIAQAQVIGADFCHPMLQAAHQKARERGLGIPLVEADALQLPIADNALDAISIAFGFRNLANYEAGLRELYRVLKPGGMLAILEFSHPPGLVMKTAYGFYSRVILPLVATALSGAREAYTYLPDSIRKFPSAQELIHLFERAGFREARCQLLTGGIAALHTGEKSASGVG